MPELKENFEFSMKSLGFIPNSMLIMQRKPKLVKALSQLSQVISDPQCEVDRGLQAPGRPRREPRRGLRLLHGARGGRSLHFGIEERKLAAVWEYRTSPLFPEAERVALDFALATAA